MRMSETFCCQKLNIFRKLINYGVSAQTGGLRQCGQGVGSFQDRQISKTVDKEMRIEKDLVKKQALKELFRINLA